MKQVRLEQTLYHSLLKIFAVVLAVVLVFDSGLLFPVTKQISTDTGQYLANSVGVTVGVAPTEVNQLTARITELEGQLEEANERQIAVNLNTEDGVSVDRSTFVLSAILFILLVLIVLNYALDFVRMRTLRQDQGIKVASTT